jgi:hypothetical protein
MVIFKNKLLFEWNLPDGFAFVGCSGLFDVYEKAEISTAFVPISAFFVD